MASRVAPTKVHVEMRRDTVMTLKLAGYSNAVVRDMIAEKHGRVSVETIRKDVNKRLEEFAKGNKDTEKLRTMHEQRLMRLLKSWFIRAQSDSKALHQVLKIMRELVRYQGIAQPKRVQHEHLTPVAPVPRRYDYSNLTVDQLRQAIDVQEMLERAGVEVIEEDPNIVDVVA